MGDWYVDRQGNWAYDKNAPAPDPSVTQIGAVPPAAPDVAATVQWDDGAVYGLINPAQFASFDEVDSRTIQDPGAPR